MRFTYRGKTFEYFPTVDAEFRELERYIQEKEMPYLFFRVIWEQNTQRGWWKLLIVGAWTIYEFLKGGLIYP
jgi:hypothetical protein